MYVAHLFRDELAGRPAYELGVMVAAYAANLEEKKQLVTLAVGETIKWRGTLVTRVA